jgi:hypothetical protein
LRITGRGNPVRGCLPGGDETPWPVSLTLQQRSSGAERLRRQAADMDFNPVDVDPDHDHIGVREARRKMRIEIAPPQRSHFRDVVEYRRAATEADVALARGMLKGQPHQRRGAQSGGVPTQ